MNLVWTIIRTFSDRKTQEKCIPLNSMYVFTLVHCTSVLVFKNIACCIFGRLKKNALPRWNAFKMQEECTNTAPMLRFWCGFCVTWPMKTHHKHSKIAAKWQKKCCKNVCIFGTIIGTFFCYQENADNAICARNFSLSLISEVHC